MYNNVLIRRWTAFEKLGVASISAPGMYHTSTSLDPGLDHRRLPRRDHARRADRRAHGAQPEQARAAAQGTEPHRPAGAAVDDVRGVRARDSAPAWRACSRAAASIRPPTSSAMTVNRWPDGYAYTYDTLGDPDVPPEQRPHVDRPPALRARSTIANSDAGAAAFTNQAIDEAHRAVQELLVSARAGVTLARRLSCPRRRRMNVNDRALGMDRATSRGATSSTASAVGVIGAMAGAPAQAGRWRCDGAGVRAGAGAADYYPPALHRHARQPCRARSRWRTAARSPDGGRVAAAAHRRDLRPGRRRRRDERAGGGLLLHRERRPRRARAGSRQPRRFRRPRQAQRVPATTARCWR